MQKTNNKKTVFVGLSGGVDSSVSAALLKTRGYKVVGVFIRTWTPDFIQCTWRDERRDAMRVAASLDIPFLECDLEKEYKKGVADYMISEYREGRTPNPDVMCNKEVKFGGFLKWALAKGADYVATGHYAQNELKEGRYALLTAKDKAKDQAYFLYTLTQKQLQHILFPVGHLNKTEVRKLAKKFNLPTAEKKDSQGVCFLGMLDMKDFLAHYIKPKKGSVLNNEGEAIGIHDGVVFYTLGERHGFTILKKETNELPYYVIAKDMKKNTITVSHKKISQETDTEFFKNSHILKINNTNWISEIPLTGKNYTAQIRYHSTFEKCRIENITKDTAEIIFEKPQLISPGQSIVLYNKDVCMGGGVVS